MRNQKNKNKKRRLAKAIANEAAGIGKAANKLVSLDLTARTTLSRMLGNRELFARKYRNRPSLANAFVGQIRMGGNITIFRLVDGGWFCNVSFTVGHTVGFEDFGFEWIPRFGWYGEDVNINGLAKCLSFLE